MVYHFSDIAMLTSGYYIKQTGACRTEHVEGLVTRVLAGLWLSCMCTSEPIYLMGYLWLSGSTHRNPRRREIKEVGSSL